MPFDAVHDHIQQNQVQATFECDEDRLEHLRRVFSRSVQQAASLLLFCRELAPLFQDKDLEATIESSLYEAESTIGRSWHAVEDYYRDKVLTSSTTSASGSEPASPEHVPERIQEYFDHDRPSGSSSAHQQLIEDEIHGDVHAPGALYSISSASRSVKRCLSDSHLDLVTKRNRSE